jgi:hypothetical protein
MILYLFYGSISPFQVRDIWGKIKQAEKGNDQASALWEEDTERTKNLPAMWNRRPNPEKCN